MTSLRRTWAARATRLLAGVVGAEPNEDRRSPGDDVLDTLDRLDDGQIRRLAVEWHQQSADARQSGWARAKQAIAGRRAEKALAGGREVIAAWSGAQPSDYKGMAGLLGRPTPETSDRSLAGLAALDALVASLAHGELANDELDALVGPWRLVTGTDADRSTP